MTKTTNRTPKNDKRAEKRAQRLERNRIRTVNHVLKMLTVIEDAISKGYNHFAWSNAAEAYQQVSTYLSPNEYNAIGEVWSKIYSDERYTANVCDVIGMIKNRFITNTNS